MKGIQARPDWTVSAAASAFLAIGLIFAFWWWYFEGAAAAAHRHIRSPRDVRSFEIWNYTHLPLYLGVALTGVGIEHIVRTGAASPLHAEEAWLLSGSVAGVMMALTILGAVSQRTWRSDRGQHLAPGLTLSCMPLTLPWMAPHLSPALVVTLLATLCACQLVRIRHGRRGSVGHAGASAHFVAQ